MDMEDELDTLPPLQPAHRRQLQVLSGLFHAGLIIIAAAAIYSLQPALTLRDWAPYLVVAVAMLICAAATRGRCGLQDGGRLLTALGAALLLSLAREPQLSSIEAIYESLPLWLVTMGLGLGTLGVLLAAIAGLSFVRTLNSYLGHPHPPPFTWAVNLAGLLVLVVGVVTFLTLRRFYEMDAAYLSLLVANLVQYYLLLRVTLYASGRMFVGAAPQVYIAAAILLAFARNMLGGGMMGGEAP